MNNKITTLHLEAIENHLFQEVYEEVTLTFDPDERQNLANKCSNITEDIAIKFAFWVDENYYTFYGGTWFRDPSEEFEDNKELTSKELFNKFIETL